MKGIGRIDLGRDISWLDPERIDSGILGLDVVSRGGLPRGGIVTFWGPWSTAKTTTLIKVMAAEQRRGRDTFFGAGEGFVKDWARKNGLWIPYSKDEYEIAVGDEETIAAMRVYDAWGVEQGYGTVAVLQHVHGDGLLEAVAQIVKQNLFSVVGVDSLAVLKNTKQIEEAEIGDDEMGGGGQTKMLNRFTARITSALNTRYNDSGEIDMNGRHCNKTCVVCLNQARINMKARVRPGQGPVFQPVGGEGLKHTWHLSVAFRKGEMLAEKESLDGKQVNDQWGNEIRIRSDKSKIGPEGRSATWDLYIADHAPFSTGDIDTAKETRIWGIHYGVIEQSGNTYMFQGEKLAVGKDNVDEALRAQPELQQAVAAQVREVCRR
jgi:RecA/RadA recombinase